VIIGLPSLTPLHGDVTLQGSAIYILDAFKKKMATVAKSSNRRPRKKKAEEQRVATIGLPAVADEHLDVPTLETRLWDAACAIRGAADTPEFKDFILPDICPTCCRFGHGWRSWLVLAVESGGLHH
jgi:hypothetical protein